MTLTEQRMEVLRLALAGLRLESPFMNEKARKKAVRSLSWFYSQTKQMRDKLLADRSYKAREVSMGQMAAALFALPAHCHACGTEHHYTCSHVGRIDCRSSYLNQCPGTGTFDCALSCLRFRSSPIPPAPLVPPMPSIKL